MQKKSQETTSTHSLYITTDSKGKSHIFTAADLVQGNGYLGKGKDKFRPKKWKGHSISEKVNSPDYGKVKNFGDNKK